MSFSLVSGETSSPEDSSEEIFNRALVTHASLFSSYKVNTLSE